MTFTFPAEKEDFTAENGVTYSWTGSHWRVKSFKLDDSKVDELREEFEQKLEEYLPLAGGEMEGDISAGGHAVSNLGNPEYAGHATPRRYVDEADMGLQLEIDNLKQEIEHLAPSFERGEWTLTGPWPQTGQYGLYKTTSYADAVQKINDEYAECCVACNTDPSCLSDCNREQVQALDAIAEYNPEEGGTGFIDAPERDWELVNRVVFYEEDAIGNSHNFDDVEEGQYMDLYNKGDDGYFIARVLGKSQDPNNDDIYIIDVKPVQWSDHPPDGRALVKFFTVDDGVDVTEFVRKSGDTITGQMFFEDRIDIKKAQDTEKPDNSFVLTGPMWNSEKEEYEMKTLLKDYRPSAKSKYSASIWYYGRIHNRDDIINLGYLKDNYLPLTGGSLNGNLLVKSTATGENYSFGVYSNEYENGSKTIFRVTAEGKIKLGAVSGNPFMAEVGNDAVSKAYLDQSINLATGDYLPLTGGLMTGKLAISYMAEDGDDRLAIGNGSFTSFWVPKGHQAHCRGRMYVNSYREDGGSTGDDHTLATIQEARDIAEEDYIGKSGTQLLKSNDWNLKGPKGNEEYNYIHIKGGRLYLYHVAEATSDLWAPNWGQTKKYVQDYVADNKGDGKVIIESGTTTPTLAKGQMFLNTTTKTVYIGT